MEQDLSRSHLIRELRKLSGLSWEESADLLGVEIYILYQWAEGHPIPSQKLHDLFAILDVLCHIDRGYGEMNRDILLDHPLYEDRIFLALKSHDFDQVRQKAGASKGRVKSPQPLPWHIVETWGPEHLGDALSRVEDIENFQIYYKDSNESLKQESTIQANAKRKQISNEVF